VQPQENPVITWTVLHMTVFVDVIAQSRAVACVRTKDITAGAEYKVWVGLLGKVSLHEGLFFVTMLTYRSPRLLNQDLSIPTVLSCPPGGLTRA
jgi:hypothetical protein